MRPQLTVTAAKKVIHAANSRIAFGLVKEGDLRKSSSAMRPRIKPTVSDKTTMRGTTRSWIWL